MQHFFPRKPSAVAGANPRKKSVGNGAGVAVAGENPRNERVGNGAGAGAAHGTSSAAPVKVQATTGQEPPDPDMEYDERQDVFEFNNEFYFVTARSIPQSSNLCDHVEIEANKACKGGNNKVLAETFENVHYEPLEQLMMKLQLLWLHGCSDSEPKLVLVDEEGIVQAGLSTSAAGRATPSITSASTAADATQDYGDDDFLAALQANLNNWELGFGMDSRWEWKLGLDSLDNAGSGSGFSSPMLDFGRCRSYLIPASIVVGSAGQPAGFEPRVRLKVFTPSSMRRGVVDAAIAEVDPSSEPPFSDAELEVLYQVGEQHRSPNVATETRVSVASSVCVCVCVCVRVLQRSTQHVRRKTFCFVSCFC